MERHRRDQAYFLFLYNPIALYAVHKAWERGGRVQQEIDQRTEQAVLDKLKHLEPQQIAEVMDFIDFLAERKQQQAPLVQLLSTTSGSRVGLEEVQRRLAKIPGKMSETVRELRDERG